MIYIIIHTISAIIVFYSLVVKDKNRKFGYYVGGIIFAPALLATIIIIIVTLIITIIIKLKTNNKSILKDFKQSFISKYKEFMDD